MGVANANALLIKGAHGKAPDDLVALPSYKPDEILAGLPPATHVKPVGQWFSWLGLFTLLFGVLLRGL
jgi:hypothetical protein